MDMFIYFFGIFSLETGYMINNEFSHKKQITTVFNNWPKYVLMRV